MDIKDKPGLNSESFYLKLNDDYLELNVDVIVMGNPKKVKDGYEYQLKFLTDKALKLINKHYGYNKKNRK
jgi:hypothetical protein